MGPADMGKGHLPSQTGKNFQTANLEFLTMARSIKMWPRNFDNDRHTEMKMRVF